MSMDAYNNYMALIQQGVPQYQAYQQSGLGQMAAQWDEQRRQQAIEQEKLIASQEGRAGRQQLGGQLTGALATKAGYNYLMNKPLLGETGKAIATKLGVKSSLLGTGSTTTAATTGGATAGGTTAGGIAGGGAVTGGATAGGVAGGTTAGTTTAGTTTAGTGGAGAGASAASTAGYAVAAYNVGDALNNALKGSRRGKGAVEGFYTTSGAIIGGIMGGGLGAAAGSVIGRTVGRGWASIGERLGAIGGRTTEQYQLDRWEAVADNAASDAEREWAINAMEKKMVPKEDIPEHLRDNVWDEGPLKGRNYNINELQNLGRPEDLWGEYALFEAFPDYLSGYSEEQRRTIVQAAMDENLFETDKGSVLFSGKRGKLDRVREIGAQVKAGEFVPKYTDEERLQRKLAYAEKKGIPYDPRYQTDGIGIGADIIDLPENEQIPNQQGVQ